MVVLVPMFSGAPPPIVGPERPGSYPSSAPSPSTGHAVAMCTPSPGRKGPGWGGI